MATVRSLLADKGYDVWSIGPEASVHEALVRLAEKNVGALVVLGDGDVVGIVSERDYTRKVELLGKNARETTVGDIMTLRVVYVSPERTVEECMALMTEMRIRHLPVVQDDRLIGVVSIGDVVKTVVAEKEFMIKQLERYIVGR